MSNTVNKQLRSAIAGKRLIQLRYDGSVRVVEPHDYGVKSGTEKLLAYQQSTTDREKKSRTGWRWLEVAKISDCVVLNEPFKGSRGEFHQKHHTWDVLYGRVE